MTQGFTVSNTGTGNLVVGASTLTGPDAGAFAFVSGQAGFTIAPGASSLIEVRFSPPTEGPKSATLTIPSNDPDENPILIPLTGTGGARHDRRHSWRCDREARRVRAASRPPRA